MNSAVGRRIAAALLILAAGWFLVHAVVTNWEALREHEWRVNPALLFTSIAAHLAVLAWGVTVWRRVLQNVAGAPVRHRLLFKIWFVSNLAKYIPGKIFQFVAVAHLGRGEGIPGSVLVASLLVHSALALLSAGVLSAATLAGQLLPGVYPVATASTAALVATLLVHPVSLNVSLGLVSRVARRELLRWNGRWRDGLILLLLSLIGWLLYGGAYFLFLSSLTPLPLATLPTLAGVNALAFLAGYLAIVSPGGLGVREAAMAALLLPLLPSSVAAVLAISSRLWTILTEVIGGVLVLLLVRRTKRTESLSPDPFDTT